MVTGQTGEACLQLLPTGMEGALLSCWGVCVCPGLTPCKWDDCLMCLMHISWTCGTLLVTLAFIVSALALFLGVFWCVHSACRD